MGGPSPFLLGLPLLFLVCLVFCRKVAADDGDKAPGESKFFDALCRFSFSPFDGLLVENGRNESVAGRGRRRATALLRSSTRDMVNSDDGASNNDCLKIAVSKNEDSRFLFFFHYLGIGKVVLLAVVYCM